MFTLTLFTTAAILIGFFGGTVKLHLKLTQGGCGQNLGPIYVRYPKLNRNSESLPQTLAA